MLQSSLLVNLHDEIFLNNQKKAGKCVSEVLKNLKRIVEYGADDLSGKILEGIASGIINDHQCTPTFHNYKGFPGKICVSVNKELVHGIPNDKKFKEGDVVKIDLGATYNGAIADAALTCVVGGCKDKKIQELVKIQELIETCEKALDNAIKNIKVGKRLGCIGNAIHHTVKSTRFGLITNYGGHHISVDENNDGIPHAQPFVANKSQSNEGIRFQAGMTLAIEPMLTLDGDTKTKVLSDGWTVETNSISVHEEATIFVHQDCVEVITDWRN